MSGEVLIHAWRHTETGKVHVRSDCHAVRFLREQMEPLLIRADDPELMTTTCLWCLPMARELTAQDGAD